MSKEENKAISPDEQQKIANCFLSYSSIKAKDVNSLLKKKLISRQADKTLTLTEAGKALNKNNGTKTT